MKVYCDYCGKRAEYVDSAEVYGGRSHGMIYLCRDCGAYTGVDRCTARPLGRLANAELRHWKVEAHKAFDPLWKYGRMRRSEAYIWLAVKMGIPVKRAHIGMFNIKQCKQVVEICVKRSREDE